MRKFFIALVLSMCLSINSAMAADAVSVLNSAQLTPVLTGYEPCDRTVLYTLSRITNNNMSTYAKVQACYDWLIVNCRYGYLDNFTTPELPHEEGATRAMDMLNYKLGACDDYSCAFAAMTRALGLNCYTVYGKTSRADGGYTGHIWCVIKVDGVEYVFDPQVEDNIARGGDVYYYRFCKTYDEVSENYIPQRIESNYFTPLY